MSRPNTHQNPTKTLYDRLGLPTDATADDIKRAYRRLALRYHPDHNPNDPQAEEHFKAISSAYEVLSDPARRRAYNAELNAAAARRAQQERDRHSAQHPHPNTHQTHRPREKAQTSSSWFEDLFGGGSGKQSPRAKNGRDVAYDIELQLEDVLHGFETTLRDLLDHPRHAQWHDADGGLRVRIPAGVKDGQRFEYKNLGEAGSHGGSHGDLYLVARILPHPLFERTDDIHLRCTVPVTFSELALGAEIPIPTLEGLANIRIPPYTQSGKRLRMRGLGLPSTNNRERGDILIEVVAETPRALSPEQRHLLSELDRLASPDDHLARHRFFEKLRERYPSPNPPPDTQ